MQSFNTFLEHPELEPINEWFDEGAVNLHFDFEKEKRFFKIGPLFDEGGLSNYEGNSDMALSDMQDGLDSEDSI